MVIERGDIVLVDLDPVKGSEQGGTRLCVIIQNNTGNIYSPTTIIAPITATRFNKEFPTNINLSRENYYLDKDSTILLNQIKTIDNKRIIKKLGYLDQLIMQKVNLAIKISLNLK